MTTVPLFDQLRDKIIAKGSQVVPDRNTLAEVLNNLDPQQANELTILIIHYYFLTNPGMTSLFKDKTLRGPYGIKVSSGGKGISLDLNLTPDPLILLIAEFCGFT